MSSQQIDEDVENVGVVFLCVKLEIWSVFSNQ